jgi:hypothetical protein
MSIGTVLLLSIVVSGFCRLPALMVLVPVGRKIFSFFSAFFRVFVDVLDDRDDFHRFAGEILWFPISKTLVFLFKIQKLGSLSGKKFLSAQREERELVEATNLPLTLSSVEAVNNLPRGSIIGYFGTSEFLCSITISLLFSLRSFHNAIFCYTSKLIVA